MIFPDQPNVGSKWARLPFFFVWLDGQVRGEEGTGYNSRDRKHGNGAEWPWDSRDTKVPSTLFFFLEHKRTHPTDPFIFTSTREHTHDRQID